MIFNVICMGRQGDPSDAAGKVLIGRKRCEVHLRLEPPTCRGTILKTIVTIRDYLERGGDGI